MARSNARNYAAAAGELSVNITNMMGAQDFPIRGGRMPTPIADRRNFEAGDSAPDAEKLMTRVQSSWKRLRGRRH